MVLVRRLLRILVIPPLLAGLGYSALQAAQFADGQLAAYPGPALGSLSPGTATAPLSERVVVVIIDGLREDTSHQMPAVQALRGRGADLPSWTELPAISMPGYTALGTGAYPDFSGVTTNRYQGPLQIDSIFAQAQQAGLSTGLATMTLWEDLYAPWASFVYTASWSASGDYRETAWTTEAIGQVARERIQAGDVALLYVHFGEVDEAGHQYGGNSPEYLEAALHVDAEIAALVELLDWSRDTLVVTADHGMLDDMRGAGGGHGGGEEESRRVPLVLAGRGIAPGSYPDGGQADVVPTIAALLGLPIPTHSQGRTRLDALALTAGMRATKALALAEQQERLYTAYMHSLGAVANVDGLEEARSAMAAGDHAQVTELVPAYLDRLDATVVRAAANYLWQARLIRLPYIVVPLLAGALFVGLYRSRRDLLWPLLLTLLFFVLHVLVYWVIRGFSYSLSTTRAQSEEAFFLARMVDAAVVMALVAVVAGVLWRRRPWEKVVWQANLSALMIGWALVTQIGLFLWLYGLRLTWQLPNLTWGFKYYLDLLAAVGVGFVGFVFALLVLGISRLFFVADWVRRNWRGWWQFVRDLVPWRQLWASLRRLFPLGRARPRVEEQPAADGFAEDSEAVDKEGS